MVEEKKLRKKELAEYVESEAEACYEMLPEGKIPPPREKKQQSSASGKEEKK